MGVDHGKINISYMHTTNKLVPTISIFGDCVNTAARMEQTCLPSLVHLTKAAAERLVHERAKAPTIPPHQYFGEDADVEVPYDIIVVKSKGEVATAWLDTSTREFADMKERQKE
uniref:Guanylate cyclase domain-containing protein n=1 Tax=Hemiselmis andersenii TaxID=464988 RepID=A0A7S1DG93_HEMAN